MVSWYCWKMRGSCAVSSTRSVWATELFSASMGPLSR